jgi:hypothetical protein
MDGLGIMKISSTSSETFILLNGIKVNTVVDLRPGVQLCPADTSHLDFGSALATCSPKFGSRLRFRAGSVWASLDISMG